LALAVDDVKNAASEKHKIEEKQREEKRKREKENITYKPKWFEVKKIKIKIKNKKKIKKINKKSL
jgi:hypothetical protein